MRADGRAIPFFTLFANPISKPISPRRKTGEDMTIDIYRNIYFAGVSTRLDMSPASTRKLWIVGLGLDGYYEHLGLSATMFGGSYTRRSIEDFPKIIHKSKKAAEVSSNLFAIVTRTRNSTHCGVLISCVEFNHLRASQT